MKNIIFSLIILSMITPVMACDAHDDPSDFVNQATSSKNSSNKLSVLVSPAAKINIIQPYSRITAPTVKMGAVFLELHNDSDTNDILESASTPIAQKVQIHETTTNNQGIASMHELKHGLKLPAHQTIKLAPGGYHIMLMGLTQPALTAGQQFPITLHFSNSRTQTVTVTVKNMPMKMHHHH